MTPKRSLVLAILLAACATVAALAIRPITPPDETRYLTVAREMQASGDWLVPTVHGKPYADKPPVVFWTINAAWRVFGDSDLVARCVPPCFALLCLVLVAWIARLAWPDRPHAAAHAPLILAGAMGWAFFGSLLMFDAPLTACVLGVIGAGILAVRTNRVLPWVLAGALLGVGIVTKGPIVLLHSVPPLLLAPLWLTREERGARAWAPHYLGLLGAIAMGALLALSWALPAAHHGGEAFGANLIWRQTAHRMVKAFAHARPPWWYAGLLPVLLLPWALWAGAWRALVRVRAEMDFGLRACLTWVIPALIFLSLVSGKQAHYLLPILPAFALVTARLLGDAPEGRPRDVLPAAAGLVVIGVSLVIAGAWTRAHLGSLPPGWSPAVGSVRIGEPLAVAALGLALPFAVSRLRRHVVPLLAAFMLLAVLLVQASVTGWSGTGGDDWPPWMQAGNSR